ncbi:Stage 0 sporulation protein KA [Anaerohalosphaera lusitana]|uniref:Stage 0 sporulation protein KA n=1 Tax=Anaerohalosphaera lusitana TaxID=1936003 RepID=A0A1U9NNS4_9BACT|nr:ABC transporter substrate-binding protein [Anaerohalosphaera lusitana]AQT69378.1 Stage 0 sporulation protein KA [Anaerohalosphaera lusitana]
MNNRITRFTSLMLIAALAGMIVISGCGERAPERRDGPEVLNSSLLTKIDGLDPGNMRDVYSFMVAGQMFETLYQYHFLKRPYVLEPQLAAAMPQISEDRLTYTIPIKNGVYFQDDLCFEDGKGRELKAQDFVYAIKRIADINYLSRNWSIFDERIVGLDEFREYTKDVDSENVDFDRPVEGLQAVDDHTLVIKLTKPWPQILGVAFADIATAPIAREAVDHYGEGIISNPVGTGPYMLDKWQRGSLIELVRNPNYRTVTYPTEGEPGDKEAGYLDDAGKVVPFADRLVWRIIEEQQPRWLLFMQGKIDAIGIPKDNWNAAVGEDLELTPKMKEYGIQLKTFDEPSVFWIGFNMQDELLGNNKPLRKAINHCLNRERFIDLFFNGRHRVAHGVIPPTLKSYQEDIAEKGHAKYDLELAKDYLKKAEELNGGPIPELEVSMPGTGNFHKQYGQFLKTAFNNLGLKIQIDYMDWPTYLQKINTRSAQIFVSGVSASIPDAIDFLGLFDSRDWAPGSNNFNYKNEQFDELFQKAEIMPDSPERTNLYRQMENIVLEDCPAAFMNHRVAYVVHHRWYKNYKPHVFSHKLSKYRRIELEETTEE